MVRQEVGAVLYKAQVWHFLRGASPRWVRPNQSPISSVAPAKEGENLNNAGEAYTENHAGRKGERTFLKQSSLVTPFNAVGEGVILSEANTKGPSVVRFRRDCRGLSAWHAWREMSGTWEVPWVPARTGRSAWPKRRVSGYPRGVRSSVVLGGGRAVHKGKEATLLRSLQREHGPDKENRQ